MVGLAACGSKGTKEKEPFPAGKSEPFFLLLPQDQG